MSENYRLDSAVTAAEYDAFVVQQSNCNLLQSSNWAKVKSGWDSKRIALRDSDGAIVAAGLVLIRPLKLGYTMWYMPHGPILDYANLALLQEYLRQLAAIARPTKCVFIKIDPPVALEAVEKEKLTGVRDPQALAALQAIQAAGFRHQGFSEHMHETLQPRVTTATLRPPEGKTLLDVVPKRTRRFVKDAQARFVTVKKSGFAELDDFMAVIEHTEDAKGIRLRPRAYYGALLDIYGEDAVFYMAYLDLPEAIAKYREKISQAQAKLAALPENAKQKRKEAEQQIASSSKHIEYLESRLAAGDAGVMPLAGCLSVLYGTGFEMLYAGMNRNYAKITAQDLVYVNSMNEAFKRGARYCSIGGVENSLDDGLMEFKSHFSPIVIEKLGEFDYPIRSLLYRGVRFLLRHRR